MTSTTAVAIAGLLQILLRTSFFIEQSSDLCSPAPQISSWIFLIAFLDILSDTRIYPMRYMHLPYIIQIIVETIFAILLTEFGAIIVWCTIEKLFCRLVKSGLLMAGMALCTYTKWETYILGVVMTGLSLLILIYVGQATDHFHVLKKKYNRIERKVAINMETFWRYVNSSETGNKRNKYGICTDAEDGLKTHFPKKRKRRRCI